MLARRGAAAVAVLAAAGLLSGCGDVVASKSGPGVPELTVTLALADAQGRPATQAAEFFADVLARTSDGAVQVEVVPRAHLGDRADEAGAENAYDGIPYVDVTQLLLGGAAELAILPDFAVAEAGSHSLTALKAPLTIDSDALMSAIAEELSPLVLADVAGIGARGLALLPESLRHPVGFGAPLESLSDFEAATMRIVDPYVGRTVEALGATAVQLEGSFGGSVAAGEVQGAESAFAQRASLPVTGIFTSDITLGAKFNVLAAHGPWFDTLSPEQRKWVERAAAETAKHVIATHRTDAQEGADYCAEGGWVVHAGADVRAEVAARTRPLVERIAEDPASGPLYQAIVTLAETLPPAPAPAAPCAPEITTTATLPRDTEGVFPEGSYRAQLTVEDFTSAGVDESLAYDHDGIWTLTFRDGFVWDIGCSGSTYAVEGDRVVVTLGRGDMGCGSIPGGELFSARWTLEDGILRFHDIGPGANGTSLQTFSDVLWGSQDWVRIR